MTLQTLPSAGRSSDSSDPGLSSQRGKSLCLVTELKRQDPYSTLCLHCNLTVKKIQAAKLSYSNTTQEKEKERIETDLSKAPCLKMYNIFKIFFSGGT